jgi:hypothetical protein
VEIGISFVVLPWLPKFRISREPEFEPASEELVEIGISFAVLPWLLKLRISREPEFEPASEELEFRSSS